MNLEHDFKSLFLNDTVICLQETWFHNDYHELLSKVPDMSNFNVYIVKATKLVGPGRPSGGLIMFIHKKILSEILFQSSEHMFCKVSINSKDIIIGSVYLQPLLHSNTFDKLEEIINNLENQFPDTHILVGGDFNTRIGLLNIAEEDEIEGTKLWDSRHSKDTKLDPYALELLDIMNEQSFLVLNGRSVSDREGEFTFVGPNGTSVIDLV